MGELKQGRPNGPMRPTQMVPKPSHPGEPQSDPDRLMRCQTPQPGLTMESEEKLGAVGEDPTTEDSQLPMVLNSSTTQINCPHAEGPSSTMLHLIEGLCT